MRRVTQDSRPSPNPSPFFASAAVFRLTELAKSLTCPLMTSTVLLGLNCRSLKIRDRTPASGQCPPRAKEGPRQAS